MSFFGNKGSSGTSSGSTTIVQVSSNYVVSNIEERNNLLNLKNGAICLVQDASGDPTVESGFAVYQKLPASWVKISDENILNIRNTDSIVETNEKQFVTQEEKDSIGLSSEKITAIEERLGDKTFLLQSDAEPTDKEVLWVE